MLVIPSLKLALVPLLVQVAVADWQGNRTVVMSVDWEAGTMEEVQELTDLPYPWDIEVTEDRVVVASLVCCEEWHEAMKVRTRCMASTALVQVVSIFDRGGDGALLTTIKDLPTGESIQEPTYPDTLSPEYDPHSPWCLGTSQ